MPIDNTEKLLTSFAMLAGVDVAFLNRHHGCVMASDFDIPEFCSYLHHSKKCYECCKQSDITAFRYVERTGKIHRYTCPFGLQEAIAPIIEGDDVAGYLMIGPSVRPGEKQEEEILLLAKQADPKTNTAVLREYLKRLPVFEEEKFAACCDMATVLAEHMAGEGTVQGGEKTLPALVKSYITKNLHKKITLTELSMRMHCSTVTLTESFRQEYGITIMQYLLKKRLQYAKRLLSDTNLSVGTVAEQCGFTEAAYFSRCFKKAFGVPPGDWRRN